MVQSGLAELLAFCELALFFPREENLRLVADATISWLPL